MELFTTYLARGYVPLIANIGLLALLAWGVSLFGRYLFIESERRSAPVVVIVGVLFGGAASILMGLPIEIEPGIIGDARGATILMSGVVGGPIAGVIAGGVAAATRLYIGGPGASVGSLAIAVYAAVGIGWGVLNAKQGRPGIRIVELICLASIAVALSAPLVLMFPPENQFHVLTTLWPQLFVANIVGVTILGTFINREYRRRQAEQDIARERARAEQEAVARTRFLNAMSHEMRTPLNGLLGILQLVGRKNLPEDVRRDLAIAMDSGHLLLSLINQVLDLAKLDAGQVIVSKQPFTLKSLIDDLYSTFKFQADAKGLYLKSHVVGDGDEMLSGDAQHIRQILFNLLGNAVKFTRAGGVDLIGRVEKRDGRRRLRFEVTDTGPGIPEDERDRIFEEFHQTEAGRNIVTSTGLGLSISRQLADALDATLSVDSVAGEGSTFILDVDVEEAAGEFMTSEGAPGDVPLGRSLSILVAEDNSVNQLVVRGMLEDDGHTVTMADNGRIAVEHMESDAAAYDLVLMDVQMPEMDGIAATRAIRRLADVDPSLPILGLTANAFAEQHSELLEAGMNAVLTKPLSIDALRRKLAEAAGSSAVGQTVPAPDGDGRVAADAGDSGPGTVNYDAFRMLLRHFGDRRLIEMVTEFEVKSLTLITRLRESDNANGEIAGIAHELRGMASNFGFVGTAKLLEDVEHADLDDETFAARLDRVDDELEHAIERAHAWIRTAAATPREDER